MKKVLFATTALIATAGMAAADVKLSGYGRFGVRYMERATAQDETGITSRFRLNIDGSTTADNGVTFGARVRVQGSTSDATPTGFNANTPGFNGARFYAMANGLTVAAGNVLGALDSMPNLYTGSVGLTGLSYANVVTNLDDHGYTSTGAGANGIEVIYSADMYTIHASYNDTNANSNERFEIAGSANFQGWTVALGYQDSNAADDVEFIAIVGGEVGPATVAVAYAQDYNDWESITISADVEVAAATSIQAYYNYDEESQTTNAAGANFAATDNDSYGIGFVHDLGGGASLRGGVASLQGAMQADLGVLFNF